MGVKLITTLDAMLEKELKHIILSNCNEYIKQLGQCTPGNILLRGSFRQINSIMKFDHNLDYRKPLHTPENIHNLVNDTFESKFGWKIRNGAFCYGFNIKTDEIPKDLGYGTFFIFLPIGNFQIAYSPTMFDMFGYIHTIKVTPEIIQNMDFASFNLCAAIESGERKHINVSNEISVYTNSYYLLNYLYRKFVLDLIWG